MSDPIDIGHGATISFFGWSPDRTIEGNRVRYEGLADIPKAGLILWHPNPKTETGRCGGGVHFDVPGMDKLFPESHRWQVLSWEPLTLAPSILCKGRNPDGSECGFHGYIRDGRWEPA